MPARPEAAVAAGTPGADHADRVCRPSVRGLAGGGLAIGAVTFGFARYGYGLFAPELRAAFGLSAATLGSLSSAAYAAYLLALATTGRLVSRRGPRLPVLLASAFAGLGTALVAAATGPRVLAAGVILAGASAGFAWAPYSDATLVLRPERREPTMAWISSGCTFALMVVAPLALVAGDAWRAVWVAFAVSAVVVGWHNARHVPPDRVGAPRVVAGSRLGRCRALLASGARPLLAGAIGYTVVGSVYWTFAADLSRRGGLAPWTGPVLWGLIGLGGTLAPVTSRLVARHGLGVTRGLAALVLAVALVLLTAAPGSLAAVLTSGLLFGAGYMISVALLPIWGARTWPEQPVTGLISAIAASGIGAIGGPLLVGWLAGPLGLEGAMATSAVALGLALLPAPGARARWSGFTRHHRPRPTRAHDGTIRSGHAPRFRRRPRLPHHRRRESGRTSARQGPKAEGGVTRPWG